ncbi:hypothetical protein OKW34_004139 [Paraburkholderia youngii]
MTKPRQHTGPVMGAATGLHDDTTHGPVGEERYELRSFQNFAVNRASFGLDIVNLENALGQVDGNGRGFHLVLLDGKTMWHVQDASLRRLTAR